MTILLSLAKILIFPGAAFLSAYSLILQFLDRKLYARLQNRQGPPWYQPIADFFKLVGKESIIPADANKTMFRAIPLFSLAAVLTAFLYIPVLGRQAAFSFEGDMVVVLYLLTVPTLCEFLAGWYSRSIYATIGATRLLTQMFAYEVPLFLALLAPTLLSGTWSVSGTLAYYSAHPALALLNIPAFLVSLLASQCKLGRLPFDAPEAETEIVSGPLVEYGGRYLAFLHYTKDTELVVLLSLLASLFIPFTTGILALDLALYFLKTLAALVLLSVLRGITARLRINQIVSFCWQYLTPVAFAQIILNLIIRSVLAL